MRCVVQGAVVGQESRGRKPASPAGPLFDRVLRGLASFATASHAVGAIVAVGFLIGFVSSGITGVLAAELSWTGTWDTPWLGGGASVTLEEHDGKVTGEYPAYGGKINGVVHDHDLTGIWIKGPRSGGIDFVMASDGRSFIEQYDNGEWWTGSGVLATSRDIAVDQSGARETFRTFVVAGDAARRGGLDELAKAAAVLDFGEAGTKIVPARSSRRPAACLNSSTSRPFISGRSPANVRRAIISISCSLSRRPTPLWR